MKLTIGFIGFGKSTNRYHLPYVLLRDNINVKTIFNRSRKKDLEDLYSKKDITFTADLEDILLDEEIQLVSICTPHNTHFQYAKQCLEHNKHVLVEKPFAFTADEAQELLKLAKEKNLVVMPFQNRRFDSDFLAIKKVIKEKLAGDVIEIESHFDYYRPDYPDFKGSVYEGAFYGLAVHLIDQAVSLFGKPSKVYYDIRAVRNRNNPDDYYHVELFYDHFKMIVKTNHLVAAPYPKFIVHGTKGSFIKYGIDKQEECLKAGMSPSDHGFGVDPEEKYGRLVLIDEKGKAQEEIIPTPLGDYGKVYDHLFDVIVKHAKKLVSDEEILTVVQILEAGVTGENPKILELAD
ncbi:oxidoreductase [Metabacillus arenae]|uniref:Oxidoreductase n=1 Tax=Metabacillus arenae TaxID=2771434 RepID=A0A926RW82_9BACI|nr:oxidoreductase [Metabacillus arenae]MBD1380508.1 oxidoreductase [Metabacillus arenae]